MSLRAIVPIYDGLELCHNKRIGLAFVADWTRSLHQSQCVRTVRRHCIPRHFDVISIASLVMTFALRCNHDQADGDFLFFPLRVDLGGFHV